MHRFHLQGRGTSNRYAPLDLFVTGLLLAPEDGGDTFLQTVGELLLNYKALQHRSSHHIIFLFSCSLQ
jgi:hypothetical protein